MSYLKKPLHRIRLIGSLLVTLSLSPDSPAQDLPVDAPVETNTAVVDTLVQEPVEITEIVEKPTVPETVLRDRLAKLERDIPLTYNKTIQGFVDHFTFRKPDYTRKVMERMPMFFPLYEKMLTKYELPDELKYLSIVESSLDPKAMSWVGAGGLWQFMPYTGRDFKLYQDDYIDERMDPVKSTEAACKYLRQLHNIFGDWHLALAAYNSGPGTVKRAMRRSGGDSFWTIYNHLPKETRAYVPQFIALTYMMNFGNDHGIYAVNPQFPVPFDTLHVNSYFCLQKFSKFTGVPLEQLQKMNPAITTTILPEHTRNYVLRVPADRFEYFETNRKMILDSVTALPAMTANMLLASVEDYPGATDSSLRKKDWFPYTTVNESPERAERTVSAAVAETEADEEGESETKRKTRRITHVVRRGEVLAKIAQKYDVAVRDLKKWNHLSSSTVRKGQKLTILRVEETSEERVAVKEKSGKTESIARKERSFKPRYHRVQQGDTLWSISQRYGDIPVDKLKKMNKIKGNTVKPGQRLIVG